MFLAYENDQLAGYRVTLPDQINVDGNMEHMGWYSCVWVDPNMRGKGIAKQMVEHTLEAWQQRILLQNPIPASEALYRGSGLFPRDNYRQGFRGYFRPEFSKILSSKGGIFKALGPAWSIADWLAKPVNSIRLGLSASKFNVDPASFQAVTNFDDRDDELLSQLDSKDLTRKRSIDLNWWINYPWVLSSSLQDRTSSRYYFSAIDDRFEFLPFRLFDASGNQNGLILFSIRGRELRTAYARLERANIPAVASLIASLMYQLNLATFTTFSAELVKHFEKNGGYFMFQKSLRRLYLVSKVFDQEEVNMDVLRFQDGDGDAAFT